MRGVTALGGRGLRVVILSLSAIALIYIVSNCWRNAAPYAVEVSGTGVYPVHDYDARPSETDTLVSPEVTTLGDEDHPESAKWRFEAMAKIKDKIGSWLPMDKVYGAMRPPWRDYGKSMDSPAYHQTAPTPPKEGRNVIVGKISILNDPDNEYIDRAVRTHTVHDKRHGYQHYIMREQPPSTANENFAAQMLSVLQAELSKPQTERLEWLYYFPATSIILNPNVPLELFLPPTQNSTFEERHILYSEPVNTASPTPDLSNTVFAAKVHQWSIDLFTTLVARTQSHSKQSNHHPNAITLQTLLTLPAPLSPKAHALGLPPHWLNAWPSTVPTTAAPSAPTHIYTDPTDPEDSDTDSDTELPHQVRRGSFVLDLPLPPRNQTVSNDDHGDSGSESRWQDSPPSPSDEDEDVDDETSAVLAQRFEHWLARAEARMPLWEAPLQETWYASEAREFWAGGQKDESTTMATAPVTTTPVAGDQAGGHQGSGTPSLATAALGQQVAQLKEEALTLVREMEAAVHDWRQEVGEEVRRATESRCGRARETLAEVEIGGVEGEEEVVRKLQEMIGGLKKASSRFHRHTTHARHAILSAAQLTLSNATAAITTVHTSIPASVSADAAGVQQLKARIEAAVQTTLHLKSLLERKDCATDDVKTAVVDVEEAVRQVETQIKQAAAQEKRRAKEIERLRQEEEKLAGMEAVEIERQQKQEEAESKMSLAGLPKPW